MKYIFVYFVLLFLFVCCSNSTNKDTASFCDDLDQIVKEYIIKYPIREVQCDTITKQSYYLSFALFNKDTVITICRQPFLFDLFPDYFFKGHSPDERLEPINIIEYNDSTPVIVFDQHPNISHVFLKQARIPFDKGKLENYRIREVFDKLVPPMWIYKYRNKEFHFVEETDSLILK